MARYKLILSYDGTDFAGSQRQVGKRTVQGCLEGALKSLGWSGRAVQMAGRTDAGVHASGQVAAVDVEWPHGDDRLGHALNSVLPPDLAVSKVEGTASAFHPRYDASSRRYLYRLFCSPTRDPLRERYGWRVWPPVNRQALVAAGAAFLGHHDLAAFGTPIRPGSITLRDVTESRWWGSAREWRYGVTCEAFLYRMVRRMVFVQVAVAQGRCDLQDLHTALGDGVAAVERRSSALPAGLAPAHGLTLEAVAYETKGSRQKRSVESVQELLSEGG